MSDLIDLRSDTVTRPVPAMLEAMMNASIGDDVYGEDPSVNALEAHIAARFGHRAALFCPSGTMTNQIAVRAHTRPGDEVICSAECHIYNYEGGGAAANSGVQIRPIPGADGQFDAATAAGHIRPDDPHYANTSLICVEDTANRGGGSCWDPRALEELRALCDHEGLALHLDGARVFNRLVARGDDPIEYGQRFDSISVCLSKGLGAPVGSVLIGSDHLIARARRLRKMMGGGMRQAGILASAGLWALEHHVDRLADDHRRAAALADALLASDVVSHVVTPETNIVIFTTAEHKQADAVKASLATRGILCSTIDERRVRLVTHLHVDDDALERVIAAIDAL